MSTKNRQESLPHLKNLLKLLYSKRGFTVHTLYKALYKKQDIN